MAKQSQNKKSRSKKGAKPKGIALEQFISALKEAEKALSAAPKTPISELLAKQKINSTIIISSPQQVRIKRSIQWLKERFFDSSDSACTSYFGAELASLKAIEPIVTDLCTPSLFARQTLLTIYNADSVKAAIAKELAQAIEKASKTALVVLTTEDLSKKTNLPGLLSNSATIVEITDLQGPKLMRWIEAEAKRNGACGISKDAIQLLQKYFGSDTTLLAREIEKLALLSSPEAPISKELTEQLSFNSPEVTSFELVQTNCSQKRRWSGNTLCKLK